MSWSQCSGLVRKPLPLILRSRFLFFFLAKFSSSKLFEMNVRLYKYNVKRFWFRQLWSVSRYLKRSDGQMNRSQRWISLDEATVKTAVSNQKESGTYTSLHRPPSPILPILLPLSIMSISRGNRLGALLPAIQRSHVSVCVCLASKGSPILYLDTIQCCGPSPHILPYITVLLHRFLCLPLWL